MVNMKCEPQAIFEMTRSGGMSLVRATLLLLTVWVARASPQDLGDYATASEHAATLIPTFPYRSCDTSHGAYRLAPGVNSLGGAKYCFTIQVTGPACTGPCCAVDLKKIEFNVSDSCIVSPVAEVKATINGLPTPVGANYYRPALGPVGTAVLRLSFLGLNTTTARDAELCLALKPNRAGKGCDSLEKMCVPPPGTPPGTCLAAFFDTACKCCPVSQTFVPPPPRPVGPPPFQPAIVKCDVCIAVQLLPPSPDVRPYRFNNASCLAVQKNVSAAMNALITSQGIPMDSYFKPDPAKCSDVVAAVCGVFSNTADAQSLADEVAAQVPLWIEVAAGGSVCRPELEGYKVQVTTGAGVCLPVDQSVGCLVPGTPFPNCTCNTTQGILPFTVSPRYFSGNVTAATAEYCFAVNVIPPSKVVPSSCSAGGDRLTKIEWLANQNLSSFVRGFNLYPATGGAAKLSPSWGAPGANTLKVSNINWNTAQANGGLVCVEVRKGKTMEDLCLGVGGQCYTSTFNANKDCCPIYRTALGAKP